MSNEPRCECPRCGGAFMIGEWESERGPRCTLVCKACWTVYRTDLVTGMELISPAKTWAKFELWRDVYGIEEKAA